MKTAQAIRKEKAILIDQLRSGGMNHNEAYNYAGRLVNLKYGVGRQERKRIIRRIETPALTENLDCPFDEHWKFD